MAPQPAPAYYPITSDNHAAWIVATSLIFLIYCIMAVAAKLLLRVNINTMKSPDICLIACLVLLVVQTALIISACNAGLGRHTEALTPLAFASYSKYYYASTLLSIIIQAGTKISICLWITAISPQHRLHLLNRALMAVIIAWAISGVFATALQCHLPAPWLISTSDDCASMRGILTYNGVMNVLTDIAICTLPVLMMWNVQTSRQKKFTVCALFGIRILVPAITIPALVTSQTYFDAMFADPTWHTVVPTILAQISLNLSVLTACIPGLKTFLDNLLSGTANARIKGSYNLINSDDKNTRLMITPWTALGTKNSGSGTNSRRRKKSSLSAQRSVRGNSTHKASITGGVQDAMMSGGLHRASSDAVESTRILHEGIILRIDDYEVSSIKAIPRPATREAHSVSRDLFL